MCARRMAPKVPVKTTGGDANPKKCIRARFIQPRGPSKAVNPAATTTVGSMNGMAVRVRRKLFPKKSYLAKRNAAGRPSASVRKVDKMDW